MPARRVVLALALAAVVTASGCGGDSDKKSGGPANQGTRISERPAPKAAKSDAYRTGGAVVADLGFRPERDGFSFQNYGPGNQEMTPSEVEDLFGARVCAARRGAECVLTPPAQAWMAQMNKGAAGGHCYGFSNVSLRVFDRLLSPLDYGAPSIRGLSLPGNVPLQRRIAESWAVQLTPQMLLADRIGTPNELLDELTAMIKSHADTYTALIFMPGYREGHAVTPYAVEDKGGGKFAVLIYDNNYPGITRAIQFDRNQNTWEYEASTNPETNSFLYKGDAQTKTFLLSPTRPSIGIQACPFCAAPPGVPAPRAARYDHVALSGDAVNHAHLVLTDSKGRRTGYVGGRLLQEIPGVLVAPVTTAQNWLLEPEPQFYVPRGHDVRVTVDGAPLKAADNEAVSIIGGGYSAVVSDLTVRPKEKHALALRAAGTKLSYRGEGRQEPGIELGFAGAGRNERFSVATHKLEAGATLEATANPAADKLSLSGKGGAEGRTTVTLRSIKRSGVEVFRNSTLRSTTGTCRLSGGGCRRH